MKNYLIFRIFSIKNLNKIILHLIVIHTHLSTDSGLIMI